MIPNLNEIMEEYAGEEVEIVLEPQAEMTQQETTEKETVVEDPMEAGEDQADENRKRKRSAEEEEVEEIQEPPMKDGAFISNQALALWEKDLKEKDFIGESGFNKLISPFKWAI